VNGVYSLILHFLCGTGKFIISIDTNYLRSSALNLQLKMKSSQGGSNQANYINEDRDMLFNSAVSIVYIVILSLIY
jgi:hypothetical protein